MRFLFSVIHDSSGTATSDEMAAIGAFNDELEANGHLVFACGLADPSQAHVIDNRGEQAVITDGPLAVSKEFVVGFWIIDASDGDLALTLATEASKCCNRKVEVRQILGE